MNIRSGFDPLPSGATHTADATTVEEGLALQEQQAVDALPQLRVIARQSLVAPAAPVAVAVLVALQCVERIVQRVRVLFRHAQAPALEHQQVQRPRRARPARCGHALVAELVAASRGR